MLLIQNISYSIHDKKLFDSISFAINRGGATALIGENGAGKTTLFKIIAGLIQPDTGQVVTTGTIGYLPQQITEASTLSGGQQTKHALNQILRKQPSILLLDEPTNNLDADGLLWLHQIFANFHGCILFTSHDRSFIDKVADQVIELAEGRINTYGGNYTAYKTQKESERLAKIHRYQKNQEEIERLKHRISERKERAQQAALSHKKQARDNDKIAANFFALRSGRKISAQAKQLETRLSQVDIVESPRKERYYPVDFTVPATHNRKLLQVSHLCKLYGNKSVINDLSFELHTGERVWIQGANGSGKSTLLSLLANQSTPDNGSVLYGHNVRYGYLSQNLRTTKAQTGLAELETSGAHAEDCYKMAKCLQLTPTDLQRPLQQLSRGQITKLLFAKLLLEQHDILILDEPTNHLDIPTRELIEEALNRELVG